MRERRAHRLKDEYRDLVSKFLLQATNRNSLITVTHTELTRQGAVVLCYVSVFPIEREKQALEFANRKAKELRSFVATGTKMRGAPQFKFLLDHGEKNRQRIEELLAK